MELTWEHVPWNVGDVKLLGSKTFMFASGGAGSPKQLTNKFTLSEKE